VLLYVSFGVLGLPYGLSTAVIAAHITWVLPFAFLTPLPAAAPFRPLHRGGGDGPRRHALGGVQAGDPAVDLPGNHCHAPFRLRCPSTSSSGRCSWWARSAPPVYLWLLIAEQMAPFLPAVGVMIMLVSIVVAGVGFWVSGRAAKLAARVEG
jgi:spermidine/putrescine transport system permease protein